MAQLSGTSSAEAFTSIFLSICRVVDSLLKNDEVVVDVRPPVKIFGDIHGQLQDLLTSNANLTKFSSASKILC